MAEQLHRTPIVRPYPAYAMIRFSHGALEAFDSALVSRKHHHKKNRGSHRARRSLDRLNRSIFLPIFFIKIVRLHLRNADQIN